jgi:hemolysin activation/secretion protein
LSACLRMPSFLCLSLLSGLIFGVPYKAQAQTISIPSSADPSRVEERLSPRPPPPVSSLELPEKKDNTSSTTPEGAQGYRFVLKEIVFDPPDADPEVLGRLVAPWQSERAGREITVADIYQLAADLTKAYQSEGYILSRVVVPEQEIEGGTVRLAVVAGHIGHVSLSGEPVPDFPVASVVRRIESQAALNIHDLERRLLILDDLPGVDVRAVLEPLPASAETSPDPGAVGLGIQVMPLPDQYQLSLDNYGSRYVGPWQGGARAQIAHRFPFWGSVDAAYYTSPQTSELKYLSLSERVPISSGGLVLNAGLDYSLSEPGDILDESDVWSRYRAVHLGLEYPVWLSRRNRLDVTGRLDVNNVESTMLSAPFYKDKLRIARLGWRYLGYHALGETRADMNFSQGLDILGARETGSPDLSRAQGRSDFNKIEANVTRTQTITDRLSAKITLSGQYGFAPLMSSEEFGFGGGVLGRGYDPSEITGDSGLSGGIEFAYRLYDPAETAARYVPSVMPFAFYDAGKVWNRDNGGGAVSAASTGLGLRLFWGDRVALTGTVALPLTHSADNPLHGNPGSPRYLLGLQFAF